MEPNVGMRELMERMRLFMFDIEGVLCEDIDRPEALPGSVELLAHLRSKTKKLAMVTNVTRKSSRMVHSFLLEAGFGIPAQEVFTASQCAAEYLKRHHPGCRCFAISEGGLIDDLIAKGIELASEPPITHVLVGADRSMTYAKLNHAVRLVLNGAELICAGGSPIFTGEYLGDRGIFLGEGSIVECIKFATRRPARHIGKPDPFIYEEVLRTQGADPAEAVMVGDVLNSDIKGANALGIATIFLTRRREINWEKVPADQTPRFVAQDIMELKALLG